MTTATADTTINPDIDTDDDVNATDSTLPPWYLAICDAIARAIIYAGYPGIGFGLRAVWHTLRPLLSL